MSESFVMNSIKAIEDLAGKIFFPGLICSLLVEFGPLWQAKSGDNIWWTYFVVVIISAMSSGVFFGILGSVTLRIFKNKNILAPIIGATIMPLGFIGLLSPTAS